MQYININSLVRKYDKHKHTKNISLRFLGGSNSKESSCDAGDLGSIPGWGRSPGEGNGNPFQYSYLENPMDSRAWWAVVQFSSVAQLYLNLCDPVDSSKTRFPVCHQLLEVTQTHVHRVGDTTQPSHPLSSLSHHTFNLSQNQGLL